MPLKSAFAQSINSVAVKLGYEVGIHNVAQTAHAMGIESPLHETPSLSLGSSDVNLLELVNGYCTVIDDGKMNPPILITKILDRDGNIIYAAEPEEQQAIPYRSAFFMQRLLRGGLTEPGGTTAALWKLHPSGTEIHRLRRQNRYIQQPFRCLVRGRNAQVSRRRMGRRRIPEHTLPHRSLRTRQSDGLTHYRQLHPESPVGRPLRPIPCQIPRKNRSKTSTPPRTHAKAIMRHKNRIRLRHPQIHWV